MKTLYLKKSSFISVMYYMVDLLSAILLMMESGGEIKSYVLVLLSAVLVFNPLSILPVLFVSSWSISFVAFPGIAAFFYYLVLFFASIFLSMAFNKDKLVTIVPRAHQSRFAVWFALWIVVTGFYSLSGQWYGGVKVALYVLPLFLASHLHLRGLEFCRTSIDIIAVFFSAYLLYKAVFAPVEYVSNTSTAYLGWSSFRSDMNPNTAAQIVLLLFIILYCEVFRTKQYWMMVFAAMNAGTLMVLGSRTAFFTMVIIAIVYLVVILRTSLFRKFLIFGVFVALFIGLYSFGSRFERFERLTITSIANDEGSGRFYNWQVLMKQVFPNHWFKGVGVDKANYENLPIYAPDADNLYVDLLISTGVVGTLLFFAFFVATVFNLLRFRKKRRAWDFLIAIFLAYLFEGIGETVFDTPLFWYWGFFTMFAICDLKLSQLERNGDPEVESIESQPAKRSFLAKGSDEILDSIGR